MPTTAYLGLGSNVGDRHAHLQAAVDGLDDEPGVRVAAVSPVYETEAHTLDPNEEQRPFLNAVVQVTVEDRPEQLLRRVQALERAEGRAPDRSTPWRPRPLDVDLLTVGAETRQTERLTLPHPRIGERRFVLRPWADIAPNFEVPPPFGTTVRALLDACTDTAALRAASVALSAPSPAP